MGQVAALANTFDFAINEECNQYNECGAYKEFTSRNKVWGFSTLGCFSFTPA